MKTYKRYIFERPGKKYDIRVIETSANYSELAEQYGYKLKSITKI